MGLEAQWGASRLGPGLVLPKISSHTGKYKVATEKQERERQGATRAPGRGTFPGQGSQGKRGVILSCVRRRRP